MLYKISIFLTVEFYLAIMLTFFSQVSSANPSGAQIISGHVSVDNSVTGVTTITNSPNAIINWKAFNIAPDEKTYFIQENSQSAVLNRVVNDYPSGIFGQLISNGQVFLINPNGIFFGKTAAIDTQGLVASSLSLSNDSFQKGLFHFMIGTSAGNVTNEGIIHASNAGNILLLAPHIENKGILETDGGSITLAAGEKLTFTNLDNPDIHFQIQAPQDNVLNIGELLAKGGEINLFMGAMNNHTGAIQATDVKVDKQGNIQLVPSFNESVTDMPIIPQGRLAPVLNTLMQGTPEQILGIEKNIENGIGKRTNTVLTMPIMQDVIPPPLPVVSNARGDDSPALAPSVILHDDKPVLPNIVLKDDKKSRDVTILSPVQNIKINKHSGQCK